MNLNSKYEIIAAITPGWLASHPHMTSAEVREQFEQYHINYLRTIYDRQVAAGHLRPQSTQAPDAAKQERERLQREYLEHEKQQLLEQVKQLQAGLITDALSRPHAIFPDKKLVDSQATRQQLVSFLNPGEQISNPVAWLKKVLQDSPQLIQTLPFEDYVYVSPAERKQQEQEALAYDKQVFHEFCRDTERCAERDSNFNVARTVLGSPLGRHALDTGVVHLAEGVFLIGDDGQTHKLVSASTTDQHQWAQERSDLDRANLIRMSRENDFAGLREHDRRRRELPATAADFLEYQLSKGYEREVLQGRQLNPLPTHYQGKVLDAAAIRAMNREQMRPLVEHYGTVRLTARLHGVKKVRRFGATVDQPLNAPQYVFEGE